MLQGRPGHPHHVPLLKQEEVPLEAEEEIPAEEPAQEEQPSEIEEPQIEEEPAPVVEPQEQPEPAPLQPNKGPRSRPNVSLRRKKEDIFPKHEPVQETPKPIQQNKLRQRPNIRLRRKGK